MKRLLIVCCVAGLLQASPRGAGKQKPYYVQVAHALTRTTLSEGLIVAPGRFADSQMVEACATVQRIDRLEVDPPRLELRVNSLFDLTQVSVVAVSDVGRSVPGVPVVIDVEDSFPPAISLRASDPDVKLGRLHTVNPGRFRLRIRTLCAVPRAVVELKGRVF